MTPDETDEREEADAALRAALTPDAIRSATRARLVARAEADAHARGLGARRPVVSPAKLSRGGGAAPKWTERRVPLPFAGLVTLALAAALLLAVNLTRQNRTLRSTYASLHDADQKFIDSLRASATERDSLLSALTGPKVRVVGLAAASPRNPRALMFWDQASDRWTFIAHNLAPLAPGRTYQLWLVTAKEKISAGTFSVSAGGDALVRAKYPLAADALKAVAVTEEPSGGVPQPTGAIVIAGTAGTGTQ